MEAMEETLNSKRAAALSASAPRLEQSRDGSATLMSDPLNIG